MKEGRRKRLIVGISGASGAIYGIRLLEELRRGGVETHLIVTPAARKTILLETEVGVDYVESLADHLYDPENIGAAISSGSFETDGMIVIPCSMKSLSAIANSYNENLLIRASDVTLKEGRRLVLVIRETPLHKGHLRLMLQAAELGAVILPPVPAFYHRPATVEAIVDQTVGKVLSVFHIDHSLFKKWDQEEGERAMDLLSEERAERARKAGRG